MQPENPIQATEMHRHELSLSMEENVHLSRGRRKEMIQSIFSPLQSKACLTFEFITRRVLSIQEDPYQALITKQSKRYKENYRKVKVNDKTGYQQSEIRIFAIWAKDIKSQATGQESQNY